MFINIFIPSYKEMTEAAQQNLYRILHTLVRKIGHFSEYLILGAALTFHIKVICKYSGKRFLFKIPLAAGVLYAVSDELHQLFVPGRAMRFYDICIDSAGVFCGICIVLSICRVFKNRKRKQNLKNKI